MRAMKTGDLAFFYHSNCKVPGIAGIMEIVREASVDGKRLLFSKRKSLLTVLFRVRFRQGPPILRRKIQPR
jgi:hypothetical protein